MRNERDVSRALSDLTRRRDIVQGLVDKTRESLLELLKRVKKHPNPKPSDVALLRMHTFQAKVLVQVMARIVDEAAQLSLEVDRGVINKNEIQVPDYLPEQL